MPAKIGRVSIKKRITRRKGSYLHKSKHKKDAEQKSKEIPRKIYKVSSQMQLVEPKGYGRNYDEASRKYTLRNGLENRSPEGKFEVEDSVNMPPLCCVVMCGHSRKHCKMKKFPTDPKRAAVWENNIGRPNWKRSESACICECHFDETQFELYRQDGLKKLRNDAVPLIFPTHVLVVHDPSGENKWHTPEPKPQPEPPAKQRKLSKRVKKKSQICESDHMYAKDSTDEDTREDSVMCDSFCGDEVLDELGREALSPLGTNKMTERIQNGSSSENSTVNLSTQRNFQTRKRSNSSSVPQKPRASPPKPSESQMEVQTRQLSKEVPILRKPVSSRQSQSPPILLKTPDAPVEKQTTQNKLQKSLQASMKISEPPSETDCVELFETPEVWDSEDVNGSTLDSPELLKDALSFLQFMLPQKWIAFSENSGIHVALLSKSKAKSIQRSIFVPFNGNKIELYVHAKKLSKNHEIFGNASFNETEALTQDSLGNLVDRIVNIVQLFSSYEICCGATDKEYLLVWRKFKDCILDSNAFGEEKYSRTVRSVACSLLAPKGSVRCKMCDTLYD